MRASAPHSELIAIVCLITKIYLTFLVFGSSHGHVLLDCRDPSSGPNSNPSFLSKFVTFNYARAVPGFQEARFELQSPEECARFCLQVSQENLYSCKSFEYDRKNDECLLWNSSCGTGKHLLRAVDRDFYQLNVSNVSLPCSLGWRASNRSVAEKVASTQNISTRVRNATVIQRDKEWRNVLSTRSRSLSADTTKVAKKLWRVSGAVITSKPTTTHFSITPSMNAYSNSDHDLNARVTAHIITETLKNSDASSGSPGLRHSQKVPSSKKSAFDYHVTFSVSPLASANLDKRLTDGWKTQTEHLTEAFKMKARSQTFLSYSTDFASAFTHGATRTHTNMFKTLEAGAGYSSYGTSLQGSVTKLELQSISPVPSQISSPSVSARLKSTLSPNATTSTSQKQPDPGKSTAEVNITATSSTSVRVTWLHVSTNQNIALWGYRICYRSIQSEELHSIVTDKTSTEVEIGGLWSDTIYSVQVMNITSKGFGEATPPVTFRTPAEVPTNLLINFTIQVSNEFGEDTQSVITDNLTQALQQELRQVYANNSTLRSLSLARSIRNLTSIAMEFSVVFGPETRAANFYKFYHYLQRQRIYEFPVKLLFDNIPGKPPRNFTALATSPACISVTWEPERHCELFLTTGFRIEYQKTDAGSNSTALRADVYDNKGSLELAGLQPLVNYTVWILKLTTRGPGISSQKIVVRTLEKVVRIDFTVCLLGIEWTSNLSNAKSEAFRNLSSKLESNVRSMYQNESQFRYVTCLRFRNGSVLADVNIVFGQKAQMSHFTLLYDALYKYGKLGDVPVYLLKDNVPGKPLTIQTAVATASTEIYISWACADCLNTTIGFYLTFALTSSSENVTGLKTANDTARNVTITGLKKFTNYTIWIRRMTPWGLGTISAPINVKTLEDVPSSPPTRVHAHNTSSTSLLVSWDPVPIEFVHGNLLGYKVMFKRENDSNVEINITGPGSLELELRNLDKYTTYIVAVLAFTKAGDGKVSLPVQTSTEEDVPSLAPPNVIAQNTSSTSLMVTWDPVPFHYVHGVLKGYRVLTKRAVESRNYTRIFTTGPDTLQVEIKGLRKFTRYVIKVLAFTRIGNGTRSQSILVSTDEDVPSLPPTNVSAHNTSSTSLMVNWYLVPQEAIHGNLRGYRVFYRKASSLNSTYNYKTAVGSADRLEIKGLHKYTSYMIMVLAFTLKGNGAESGIVNASTDEDVPSAPPQNVNAHNTSSTGLNVSWGNVPESFVHGILRGYSVYYRKATDRRRAVSLPIIIKDSSNHSVEVTGLSKFTKYAIEVRAFTRKGEGAGSTPIKVTTDEDVPSQPPQNLRADNISSRELKIYWDPVPSCCVHGHLRGYKVFYKKTIDSNAEFKEVVIPPGERRTTIGYLQKYTNYTITVLAFTIKGNGKESSPIIQTTDEDVPTVPPQSVRAKDDVSSTRIPLKWVRPPQNKVHGILRGFTIQYRIANRNKSFAGTAIRTNASSEQRDIKGLKNNVKYEIRIAARTVKGHGPWATVTAKTCNCHPSLSTNWWAHPPYVIEATDGSYTHNGGIIPAIITDMVAQCCGSCENGPSIVDYSHDGQGKKAKKQGVIEVSNSLNSQTSLSFPVAGSMDQESNDRTKDSYEFIPVLEKPGVAFIVTDGQRKIYGEVLWAVSGRWPQVVFAMVMLYLAGITIWILDVRHESKNFTESFISGTMEGMWWSFVTMTTVGYGDRIPKSFLGRCFASVWTWFGIVLIAVMTSSITAALMTMVFDSDHILYGTTVAAIANSSEYKLAVRRNAVLDPGSSYGNLYQIYEALEANRVHAALLDSYATASEKKYFSQNWIRIKEIIPLRYKSAMGIALSGDAVKLSTCFRDFVKSENELITRVIGRNIDPIEADDTSFPIKKSSSLLTHRSVFYRTSLTVLGSALAVFVVFGLVWECFRRRRKTTSKYGTVAEGHEMIEMLEVAPRPDPQKLKKEMSAVVRAFHQAIKTKYQELRRKHRREQIKFLEEGYNQRMYWHLVT